MGQILVYATILAPIVTGLVQITKGVVGANGKLIPLMSVAIGVAVGLAYGWTVDGEAVLYMWGGLLAGMSSVGVYELVKNNGESE